MIGFEYYIIRQCLFYHRQIYSTYVPNYRTSTTTWPPLSWPIHTSCNLDWHSNESAAGKPVLKSGIMGDLRMRGMPDQVGHDGKGGRRKRWQTRKRADMTFGGRARLRFHPSHNHRFEWISHNKSHVNPRTDMANWPGCVRSVKFYWYFAWFTNFQSENLWNFRLVTKLQQVLELTQLFHSESSQSFMTPLVPSLVPWHLRPFYKRGVI